jgi:hypothetical protein
MNKRFKKVVNWKGEFNYKLGFSALLYFNLFTLSSIIISKMDNTYFDYWTFLVGLLIGNIVMSLIVFVDFKREVYHEEI